MKKFEFSLPMPYSKANINRLFNINNAIDKSKITSLYFSLPATNELFTGFEQPRNLLTQYINFDFWEELISYSLEKGFDIIYNFNLARTLEIENIEFENQLKKLDTLLLKLSQIGVNKLRIYNVQLLDYISVKFPLFDLFISTVANFNNIHQFKNLKQLYPMVKQVVPSQDMNKNFELLNNIQNKLKIDLEIMCNDGCIQGCINFFNHHGIKMYSNNQYIKSCKETCILLNKNNPILNFVKGNSIFPWEIEEYAKIGITRFKLTGRDSQIDTNSNFKNNINYLYLKGIDNIKNLYDFPIVFFLNNSSTKDYLYKLKGKDLIKNMPKIQHFKKYGHLCSSKCGIKCHYCYKCAEKIKKIYKSKIND